MKALVDPDRCQGHLRCIAFAPTVFVENALGHAEVVAGGFVPPEHQRDVSLAAGNCPESAITVIAEEG